LSVLFLGKKDDRHCADALEFTQQMFPDVTARFGEWGDKFDRDLLHGGFDIVISYLSRWIVPRALLEAAQVAINFHPASPHYPGYGCTSLALYEGAEEFGVTCHFMAPAVDTGSIIATKRFAVFESDTVATLLKRSYDFQLALYYDVVGQLAAGKPLSPSGEQWTRTAFTRKQFNALKELTPDMPEAELKRRIRAFTFNQWGPTMEVNGILFKVA